MPSPREHAAGRVGALARHREPDDPDLAEARRDLRAAEATEHAEYIRRLVDTFPPLSAEQRTKIAALLRPVVSGEDGRAALARRVPRGRRRCDAAIEHPHTVALAEAELAELAVLQQAEAVEVA